MTCRSPPPDADCWNHGFLVVADQCRKRQRVRRGGSQFNREREAVDATTDLRNQLLVGDRVECWIESNSPCDEQGNRLKLIRGSRLPQFRPRNSQWDNGEESLSRYVQRLATGGDYTQVRAQLEKFIKHFRTGLGNVLTTVNHQEQRSVRNQLSHTRTRSTVNGSQDCANGRNDQVWLRQLFESDKPDTVRESRLRLSSCLDRQPGLAYTSRAHKRDHPLAADEVEQVPQRRLSTDQLIALCRHKSVRSHNRPTVAFRFNSPKSRAPEPT